MLKLQAPSQLVSFEIPLPPSKSLANRLLLLQALNNSSLSEIKSDAADDIAVFTDAIYKSKTATATTIDVGAAGTAMRFLTAYFSQKPGTWLLTGSKRMQQRPIAPLVTALQELGADITYTQQTGYPPLLIKGKVLYGTSLTIDASISSQFISALVLIAPFCKTGLQLNLSGNVVSWPYIKMSVELLRNAGIAVELSTSTIVIKPAPSKLTVPTVVEADWSAASYYFALCALSNNSSIVLLGLQENSLQGDSCLPLLFDKLGVKSSFKDEKLILTQHHTSTTHFEFDFINCPDLAQTVAVTCFGLGITAKLSGLQTLAIKETNRLQALKTELEKCGATVEITSSELILHKAPQSMPESVSIATYHDHRMAMSFAALATKIPNLSIANEEVVTKSYPLFWKHWRSLGFNVNLQPK